MFWSSLVFPDCFQSLVSLPISETLFRFNFVRETESKSPAELQFNFTLPTTLVLYTIFSIQLTSFEVRLFRNCDSLIVFACCKLDFSISSLPGPVVYRGDLIGCTVGFDEIQDENIPIFFSLNGQIVAQILVELGSDKLDLYPFVGMKHGGIRVLAKVRRNGIFLLLCKVRKWNRSCLFSAPKYFFLTSLLAMLDEKT